MSLRILRTASVAIILSALLAVISWALPFQQGRVSTATAASSAACYGASCNGLDPTGRCNDGVTVAAMAVPDGMLELRWSKSCAANWGRYTPYTRDVTGYAWQQKSIYARVTAWNPGGTSYGLAHSPLDLYGSAWSQMVDGTKTVCTGVEVSIVADHADTDSLGWTWGPCR
jgi:hypothetical protein